MSYRVEANETPEAGVKRIALEQLHKARKHLQERADMDEAIHDARKRFKKIRAVARLVRDEVGNDIYHASNTTFRNAGRRFAPARDSQVLIETLDQLRSHYSSVLAPDAFAAIRRQLHNRHAATLASITSEGIVDQVLQALDPAEESIKGWPIAASDFAAFDAGLHRVYKRGRKAMQAANAAPTAENLHEWRKRVKYLWYHLRILRPAWPDVLDDLADAQHDLANLLGDDHDLAVLYDALSGDETLRSDDAALHALLGLATERRKGLQSQAWPLGQRLYAESPDDFTERIAAYWDAWTDA